MISEDNPKNIKVKKAPDKAFFLFKGIFPIVIIIKVLKALKNRLGTISEMSRILISI